MCVADAAVSVTGASNAGVRCPESPPAPPTPRELGKYSNEDKDSIEQNRTERVCVRARIEIFLPV